MSDNTNIIFFNPKSCTSGYSYIFSKDFEDIGKMLKKFSIRERTDQPASEFYVEAGMIETAIVRLFNMRKSMTEKQDGWIAAALIRLMETYLKIAQNCEEEGKDSLPYYKAAYLIARLLLSGTDNTIIRSEIPKFDSMGCKGVNWAEFNEFIRKEVKKSLDFNVLERHPDPYLRGIFIALDFGHVPYVMAKLFYSLGEAAFGIEKYDEAEKYFMEASKTPITNLSQFSPLAKIHLWIKEGNIQYRDFQAWARLNLLILKKEKGVKEIEDLTEKGDWQKVIEKISRESKYLEEIIPKRGYELSNDFKKREEYKRLAEAPRQNCFRVIAALMWCYYNEGRRTGNQEYLKKAYYLMNFVMDKIAGGEDKIPQKYQDQIKKIKEYFQAYSPVKGDHYPFISGSNLDKVFKAAKEARLELYKRVRFFEEFRKKQNYITDDAIFVFINIIGQLEDKKNKPGEESNFIKLAEKVLSNNPGKIALSVKNEYLEALAGKLIEYYNENRDYGRAAVLYWYLNGQNLRGKANDDLKKSPLWKKLLDENGGDFNAKAIAEAAKGSKVGKLDTEINFIWSLYNLKGEYRILAQLLFIDKEEEVFSYADNPPPKTDRFFNILNLIKIYERLGFIYSRSQNGESKINLANQYLNFARILYGLIIYGRADAQLNVPEEGELKAKQEKFMAFLGRARKLLNKPLEQQIEKLKTKYPERSREYPHYAEALKDKSKLAAGIKSGYTNVLIKLNRHEEAYQLIEASYKYWKGRKQKTREFPKAAMDLAQALVRRNECNRAIQYLKESITVLGIVKDMSDSEKLGSFTRSMLVLSWIYSEMAEEAKKRIGAKNWESYYRNLSAALLGAIIWGGDPRWGADPENPAYREIREYLKEILGKRDRIVSPSNLNEIESSIPEIQLELAGIFKSGDLIEHAAGIYADIAKSSREQKIKAIALTGLSETKTRQAELEIQAGNYNAAFNLLKRSIESAEQALILAQNNHEEVYKAAFALTWALGVKGGLLKKKGETVEAIKLFQQAGLKYSAMLDGTLVQLDDKNKIRELLHRINRPLMKTLVEYANLLKAAKNYKAADEIFRQAFVAGLEPGYDFSENETKDEIKQALAEMGIEQGKEINKQPNSSSNANVHFITAAKRLAYILDRALKGNPDQIKTAGMVMAAARNLGWALGELSRLDCNKASVKGLRETALMLYKYLLNEENGERHDFSAVEKMLGLETGMLGRIIDGVKRAEGRLIHPDVLEAFNASLWDIRASYLNALADLEKAHRLNQKAQQWINQLTAEDPAKSKRERVEKDRFLISAYMARGNGSAWVLSKLEPELEDSHLEQAEKDFQQVLDLSAKYVSQDQDILLMSTGAKRGLAYILAKKGNYRKAEGLLLEILGLAERKERKNYREIAGIYIELGMLYSQWEKYDQAIKNLEKALTLYKTKVNYTVVEIVKLYYSIGNALISHDQRDSDRKAISYYLEAEKIIFEGKRGDERKQIEGKLTGHSPDLLAMLAEIYANLSIPLRKLGATKEALKMLEESKRIAGLIKETPAGDDLEKKALQDKEKLLDRVVYDYYDIKRLEEENLPNVKISYGRDHSKYSVEGEAPAEETFQRINLDASLKFNPYIKAGFGVSGLFIDKNLHYSIKGKELPRMEFDKGFGFNLWAQYLFESWCNIKIAPYVKGERWGFTMFENDQVNGQNANKTYYAHINPGIDAEYVPYKFSLDWLNNKIMVMPYVRGGFRGLFRLGQNQEDADLLGAREISESYAEWLKLVPPSGPADYRVKEKSNADALLEKGKVGKSFLKQAHVEPGLQLSVSRRAGSDSQISATVFGGARIDIVDEISASGHGFYAVPDDTFKWAISAGGKLEYKSKRWNIGLSGMYQRGNYEYFNAALNAGCKVNEHIYLQGFMSYGQYYQEFLRSGLHSSISSNALTAGLGISFDTSGIINWISNKVE